MPPRLLVERWFAKTYNWPPDVTRRQDPDVITWFPVIETAEEEAARIRANADAGGRRR